MPGETSSTARQRLLRTAGAILVALAFTALLPPAPAAAQGSVVTIQGDPAEREAMRQRLFRALAAAPSEVVAQQIAARIWLLWFQAPDEPAADLMRDALDRRHARDFPAALEILDKLVAQAPDWAEAWNQRATLRFLTSDYEGSLADIDKVLPLEPKHFGALSGQALILRRLGRHGEAQAVLLRAVKIHPFLAERALLEPEPESEDI